MTHDPTLRAFAEAVAAATPAPGGGAVAAVTAALAAALTGMVGRLALPRAGESSAALSQLVDATDRLRQRLLELAEEDQAAFQAVVQARRARDEAAIARAWRRATEVPAEVIRCAAEVVQFARRVAREGPPSALGDAVMAAMLAAAAAAGSMVNLKLNLRAAGHPEDLTVLGDRSEMTLRDAQGLAEELRALVEGPRGEGGGLKSER
jgi:formiminotetrahydrofolate cyclodeaminase